MSYKAKNLQLGNITLVLFHSLQEVVAWQFLDSVCFLREVQNLKGPLTLLTEIRFLDQSFLSTPKCATKLRPHKLKQILFIENPVYK